jgi:hypothetical protein
MSLPSLPSSRPHLPTSNSDRFARLRLAAFRITCGTAIIISIYVAAALGQARHAGWTAVGIGLPLAVIVAWGLRDVPPSFLSCHADLSPVVSRRAGFALPAVAAALSLLVLLPVLVVKLPPLDDYANHLARIHIIAQHGRDLLLAQFYAIRWRIIPDLGMDVFTTWLAAATGIFAAGTLTVVAYTLLLFTGPFAIQAALYREISFGPLVGALFIYNSITKFGVINYLLGTGLALYGIAVWIAVRPRPRLLRAAISLAWVVLLFFCHLMALALYGLAIGSYELWLICADSPRGWRLLVDRRHLADAAVLVVPFAAAVVLLALGPRDTSASIASSWGGLHARLDGLRYVLQAYAPGMDLLVAMLVALGFIWALHRGMLQFHPFGWIFLVVAAVFYLVIPNRAMGAWGAAVRVPLAVLFVLIGVLRWTLPTARTRRAFILAVSVLVMIRSASVAVTFWRYASITADFERSLDLVTPGSRILVVNDYERENPSLTALREIACLAIIERSSLVSIAYAHPLQQILTVRPPYRATAGGLSDLPISPDALRDPPRAYPSGEQPFFAPSGRVYWFDWRHSYDYVYMMNRHGQPAPAPGLKLLYDGDRFQLFGVRPAAGA